MLDSAAGDQILLVLRQTHSHLTNRSVEVLAVVLRHTARFAKLLNSPSLYFWFDLTFQNIQHLNVRATILPACTAVDVPVTVHCAAQSLIFLLSVSVVH